MLAGETYPFMQIRGLGCRGALGWMERNQSVSCDIAHQMYREQVGNESLVFNDTISVIVQCRNKMRLT